ncbi:hypothetical protein [Streptomyces griseus]|uniref:hypothetical protein n=1 Tax=Streptomyces griseus TaxID=1911 RepID=UPI0036C9DF09
MVVGAVPGGGGFDGLDEGDQEVEDGGCAAGAGCSGCVFQGAGGGFEVGAGGALEGAGAGGAGGLLEPGRRGLYLVADGGRGDGGGDGEEVAEGGDVAGALGAAGAGEEDCCFADPGVRAGEVGGADRGVEALADAGQGEVVGEGPAGEPDGACAVVGAVAGERDRVPVDRAGGRVVVLAHAQARVAEPGEEIGGVGGEGGSFPDRPLKSCAGGLGEAAADGLLLLAGDRGAACGLVER